MRPQTSKPSGRTKPSRVGLFSAKGARDEENPFRIPPDEKIFTFKDEEKSRKLEEKKRNSKLKIWEKNKPEREGKLRAIRDTDIEMCDIVINEEFSK